MKSLICLFVLSFSAVSFAKNCYESEVRVFEGKHKQAASSSVVIKTAYEKALLKAENRGFRCSDTYKYNTIKEYVGDVHTAHVFVECFKSTHAICEEY